MKIRWFVGIILVMTLVFLSFGCEEASETVTVELSMHDYRPVRLREFAVNTPDETPDLIGQSEDDLLALYEQEFYALLDGIEGLLVDIVGLRGVDALVHLAVADETATRTFSSSGSGEEDCTSTTHIAYLDLLASGGCTELVPLITMVTQGLEAVDEDTVLGADGQIRCAMRVSGSVDGVQEDGQTPLQFIGSLSLSGNVSQNGPLNDPEGSVSGSVRFTLGTNAVWYNDGEVSGYHRYPVVYIVTIPSFTTDINEFSIDDLWDMVEIIRTDRNGSTDVTGPIVTALTEVD
jgi:hypothetical protein